MGQIRSFDDALDFFPESHTRFRGRFGGFMKRVHVYWDALVEGHAAASHYNALRARGLSHEHAASKVFLAHYSS